MGCGAGKAKAYEEPAAEAKPAESTPAPAEKAAPEPAPAPAAPVAVPAGPAGDSAAAPAVTAEDAAARAQYPEYAKIFDAIDTKSHGYILIRDVRAALKELDPQITLKQVRKLVHVMDTNNDGKVSMSEFTGMSAAIASGKEMNFHGLTHKEYRKLFFEDTAVKSKARGILKEGIKSGEAEKLADAMGVPASPKSPEKPKDAEAATEQQNTALREGLLAGLETGGLDAIADQIIADREKTDAAKPEPAAEPTAEA